MSRFFTLLVLSLLAFDNTAQNCQFTVEATADRYVVCAPGGVVTLTGNAFGGNILTVGWSPPAGLSNPNGYVTTALVTAPTTYTFSAKVQTDNNLIINGDFEAGNAGFYSDYIYNPTNLVPEGVYTVNNNPNSVHAGFSPCPDHTTGSGQMMVVNGSGTPGQDVWCQTISVDPNSEYLFSAWATSVNPASPALLQFSVNGQLLGNIFNVPGSLCTWSPFNASWMANGATSATICVVNQNTTLGGNDFALDDIQFLEICTRTAEVFIDVVELDAIILPPQKINCYFPEVQLDGSLSSFGPDISYRWNTFNGHIVSGEETLFPWVDAAGVYELTVIFENSEGVRCEKRTTTTVQTDLNAPTAYARADSMLNCRNAEVTLNGIGSSIGNHINYFWSTDDGFIVRGANSLFPVVDAPGTYELLVENTLNGCLDSAEVLVLQDLNAPFAYISPPEDLDCRIQIITLDGSSSSYTPTTTFDWSTIGGRFTGGLNTLFPTVDKDGFYKLVITEQSNGCKDSSEVQVIADQYMPPLQILAPDTLNCETEEISLSATLWGARGNFRPVWSTRNGNITGQDSLRAQVDAPGNYVIIVENLQNHCADTATVFVTQDIVKPNADAGLTREISCRSDSLHLHGSGSSTGSQFTYFWSTTDGSFLSGRDSLHPAINAPGTYLLTVRDTGNGCTAVDSVRITRDINQPVVSVKPPDTLTCLTTSTLLDARASTAIGNLEFRWYTPDGHFSADSIPLLPEADAPGWYILTISNLDNGCIGKDSVQVLMDTLSPRISAGTAPEINCGNPLVQLNGQVMTPDSSYDIEWLSPNGDPFPGNDRIDPEVDIPGWFTLKIRNLKNGCLSESSVEVTIDVAQPTVQIESPDTLTCIRTTVDIDAFLSTVGPAFQYEWLLPDGSSLQTSDPALPLMSLPGAYQLVILNRQNHCRDSAEIIVVQDIEPPVADAGDPVTLTCDEPSLPLDASNSSGGGYFVYSWTTTDGQIVSGVETPTPQVNASGIYTLRVQNRRNGCEAVDVVAVSEDKVLPVVAISPPEMLTCEQPEIVLDAAASSTGAGFELSWRGPASGILAGDDTPAPLVNRPGNYELHIRNSLNGCEASAEIEVLQDARFPVIDIANPSELNCAVHQIDLDASASNTGAQFQYEWTTLDGIILSANNDIFATAGGPGTYQLRITDGNNQCTSVATVTVFENLQKPVPAARVDDLLTCDRRQLTIHGSATGFGNQFVYQWVTDDGRLLSGINSPDPIVDEPGTYRLIVTDLYNFCSDSVQVLVQEDITPPNLVISQPDTLTCVATVIGLNVNAAGSGMDFSYLWQTTNGRILNGEQTAQSRIDAPGDYSVEVTDLSNGCKNQALVTVRQDVDIPEVEIAVFEKITCRQPIVTLDGTGSSTGNHFVYQWDTPSGRILYGATTLYPQVDRPGSYQLTVRNRRNGCEHAVSLTVLSDTLRPVALIATPEILTCSRLEIVLNASGSQAGGPLQFQWLTDDGHINSGQNSAQAQVDAPGDYALLLTNTDNGCSTKDTVFVPQDIVLPVVDAGSPRELNCTDTLVQLSATGWASNGYYDLRWSTADGHIVGGGQTLSPGVDAPGLYILQIVDPKNGCQTKDSVRVVLDSNILVAVDSRMTAPRCWGDLGSIVIESTVGGTPPFRYSINGGKEFSWQHNFHNLPPGTYDLVVLDAKGCEVTVRLKIPFVPENYVQLEPELKVILGEDMKLVPQTNLETFRITRVSWAPSEGLSCADCLSPVFEGHQTSEYTVTIEDKNGCVVSARTLVVVEKAYHVYIPNVFSPNNHDGINDVFHIFARDRTVRKVNSFQIFSRWGEKVFEDFDFQPNDPIHGWDGTYRGKALDPAVFVFFAEIEFVDGFVQLFKGDVTLAK